MKEPDEMGVWADGGETVWLPRSLYPKRQQAIMWAMEQWDCNFIEVRCRARSMRYDPFVVQVADGAVTTAWTEDQWHECEEDALGAFRVWRLEGAKRRAKRRS